jgi:membrane-bound lytic murein transglycosylase D
MKSTLRSLHPWLYAALLAAVAGCAGSPQPKVQIRYSDIDPKPAAPAAASAPNPAALPALPATEAANKPEGASLGAAISTREAMEKALAWATEGVHSYEQGKWEEARKSLNDARLMLLEADLPKFWQDQGLGALQAGLPEDLKRYDLEGIFRDLERREAQDPAMMAQRAYLDREVRRILWQFGDTSPEEQYVQMLVSESQQYIDFYRGKYREFFEHSYLRKHKYWPTIQQVFAAQKLPIELGYIAFVESGFNPKALSRANALGMWQFIPDTGRRYGLYQKEDFYDVRRSTEAAADYLLDLISIFGSPSFLLATAAYNAGEGRIMSCLRQLDNPFQKRSFWEIRGCLALETQQYVPKIMAAAIISGDPKRFGFDLPSEDQMNQIYEVVVVPQVTTLARLSDLSGVSVADLRLANTDLDSFATATPGRNFPMYMPKGTGERLLAGLATLPPETIAAVADSDPLPDPARPAKPQRSSSAGKVYVVRGGDTLFAIARKHDADVEALADVNHLRKPYNLTVGQRIVLPGDKNAPSRIVYTVQSGNSLQSIADLFSVRFRDILSWNSLKSSTTLKAGQKLHIFPPREFETHTYKVRRGDSLAAIARRFGVSIDNVETANGLEPGETLRPGQRLVVYAPA